MAYAPPPLPPRTRTATPPRRATLDSGVDDDGVPSEAPPAYSATPQTEEQAVDYGPSRPFQEPYRPAQQQYQQYSTPGQASTSTGIYSPFPPSNPLPGQSRPPLHGFNPPSSLPPPLPARAPTISAPPEPELWQPSNTPIPGQVLLRNNDILVFPKAGHKQCSKCRDTGYKSSDPSNACKKCWDKYGKPFSGALKIALTSSRPTLASPPQDAQQPLPRARPPQNSFSSSSNGFPGQQYQTNRPPPQQQQQPYYSPPFQPQYQPNYGQQQQWAPMLQQQFRPPPPQGMPLVVRPGDPRIGGVRCWECGGDGLVMGFFLSESTCYRCNGTGRLF